MTDGPVLGINLDGCVDEHPSFFRNLTRSWPGPVHLISFRDDHAKAEADLRLHGVRFDRQTLVSSFGAKAEVIRREGIRIYMDDQPEMLGDIGRECTVLLVRNGGNFDFDDRRWMFSKQTGKLVA